jgi:hypothetical protein
VSLSESLVIIGLWIIPKIQKTPAECGLKNLIYVQLKSVQSQ